MSYQKTAAKVLRVFCPVQTSTLTAMLAGEPEALERDPHLSAMVSIVRGESALGDFGIYTSVIEVSPGWELFTPGAHASPTLGEIGSPSTSPTALLTIYIADDASQDEVDRGIAALLAAHPWEVPVMELSQTMLLVRGGATIS